jgi:hypothetical protein
MAVKFKHVKSSTLSLTLFAFLIGLFVNKFRNIRSYEKEGTLIYSRIMGQVEENESSFNNRVCVRRLESQKHTFYSHVIKAGGTSINLLLLREAERRGEKFEGVSRILYKRTGEYSKMDLAKVLQKRTLWASELPFKNFAKVVAGKEWFKFVILRKPLDRFNSHRQMCANIEKPYWKDFRSTSPTVKKKLIDSMKNLQCRYVSADETSCKASSLVSWDLVLLFEEFDVGVALLCIFLNINIKDCCLPKINTRKRQSYPLPELSSSEIKYFEKVNRREILLYESAKIKFELQRACKLKEIKSYLSEMQICRNVSGVKVNKGSE